ncbi:XLF-domain-containing protein [Xylariaceae sp. FL0804]|nr:XLF-domain-containing protein [Xylariaceae sp. FL0804]
MGEAPRWYSLPAFEGAPALLISPRFASSSYTIHITDLANVWVESLDRKSILLRSLQENTSIDLSEGDAEQWAVFLGKLRAAFDPASSDHRDTSVSLSAAPPTGLDLEITCELPKPLAPLVWPVHLTKCQPASLASELVLPLVQAHHTRAREVASLIARLKDKDAVINKLVDKLAAMHASLEHVFNALSGKRKATRAEADQKVKGLAPFREDEWRAGQDAGAEASQDATALLGEVFGPGFECPAQMDVGAPQQLNDWWTKPGPKSNTAIKSHSLDQSEKPGVRSQSQEIPSGQQDDDFQVHELPPRNRSRRAAREVRDASSDDSDFPDKNAATESAHGVPAPPKSRIGALRGRKEPARDSAASQSSHTVPADEDETASESDEEQQKEETPRKDRKQLHGSKKGQSSSSPVRKSPSPAKSPPGDDAETASSSGSDDEKPPPARPPPERPSAPQRRGGLGRIGGRSAATPPRETSATGGGEAQSPSPSKVAKRKIGAIGRSAPADGEGHPPEKAEAETEEQKAERKRAELARELEKKPAGPVRKKRKF